MLHAAGTRLAAARGSDLQDLRMQLKMKSPYNKCAQGAPSRQLPTLRRATAPLTAAKCGCEPTSLAVTCRLISQPDSPETHLPQLEGGRSKIARRHATRALCDDIGPLLCLSSASVKGEGRAGLARAAASTDAMSRAIITCFGRAIISRTASSDCKHIRPIHRSHRTYPLAMNTCHGMRARLTRKRQREQGFPCFRVSGRGGRLPTRRLRGLAPCAGVAASRCQYDV